MQWLKRLFIPDDGKPFEEQITLETSERIWLQGHVRPEQLPPPEVIKFKGYAYRNWLMRRPAGRIFVYIILPMTLLALLLLNI